MTRDQSTADGDIWLAAWLAVAPSFNAKVDDCTRYADRCLAEYRKRFPPQSPCNLEDA
jgi:hypothetical protein